MIHRSEGSGGEAWYREHQEWEFEETNFKGLVLSPGSGSWLKLVTVKPQFPSVKWEEEGYSCLAELLGLGRTTCSGL